MEEATGRPIGEAFWQAEGYEAAWARGKALGERAAEFYRRLDREASALPPGVLAGDFSEEVDVGRQEGAQTARLDDAAFRDAVVAGLRERGWPEPGVGLEEAGYRCAEVVWGDQSHPSVWFSWWRGDYCAGWEAGDDRESGRITFDDEGLSPARVVEAIDRLRWVLGLPDRNVIRLLSVELARARAELARALAAADQALRVAQPASERSGLAEDPGRNFDRKGWLEGLVARMDALDPDGPLVPLPVKAVPAERPYEPDRWLGDLKE
jgi:hypothetical protein